MLGRVTGPATEVEGGSVVDFERGAIVLTPRGRPFVVQGEILAAYREAGGPAGDLGGEVGGLDGEEVPPGGQREADEPARVSWVGGVMAALALFLHAPRRPSNGVLLTFFPLGTLIVNVAGSLAMGVLAAALLPRAGAHAPASSPATVETQDRTGAVRRRRRREVHCGADDFVRFARAAESCGDGSPPPQRTRWERQALGNVASSAVRQSIPRMCG